MRRRPSTCPASTAEATPSRTTRGGRSPSSSPAATAPTWSPGRIASTRPPATTRDAPDSSPSTPTRATWATPSRTCGSGRARRPSSFRSSTTSPRRSREHTAQPALRRSSSSTPSTGWSTMARPTPTTGTRTRPSRTSARRSTPRSPERARTSPRRLRSAAPSSGPARGAAPLSLHERKGLVAGGDRSRRPLLGHELQQPADLGAGRHAQLVPSQQGLRGVARPGCAHGPVEIGRAQEGESRERPRFRAAAEAMNLPRRVVRRTLRRQERPGNPRQLPRDRVALEVPAEDDHEQEAGRVDEIDRVQPLERASERAEEPELVGAPEPFRGEALQLAEEALARGLRDARDRLAQEPLRLLVEPEAELVLEAHRAEEANGVVGEDAGRDGPETARLQVGPPAERIDELRGPDRPGHRVDREVAGAEIVFDPVSQRREVDRLSARERDPPRPVTLGQGEHGPAREARVEPRGELGIGAGHVHVDDVLAEELVAQRPTHHPRRLVSDGPPDQLIHLGSLLRPAADPG